MVSSSNQINSIMENLIDETEGTLKTIRVINKGTKEEQTPKQLLNELINKVEKGLNASENNTIKDTFKVLIDIMAADFILRMMPNTNQEVITSMFRREVIEGIIRFGLTTMFLYPYLIEQNLELKPETRDLTEEEITSIRNIKKSTKIVSYLSNFGINPIDVVSVFYRENILTEKELQIMGLTQNEVSKVKDKKDIDEGVKKTIIKLYKSHDAIVNGQIKDLNDLEATQITNKGEMN